MGDCKEWDSTDSNYYETEGDGTLLKMERKKQPCVETQDTDDNTTRDMSRVQVVEEEEILKIEPTSTALADSEEASEDKESEEGQITAKEEEREERGSLRVSREEELVRRLERLELEVRSQRARYSAGAEAGAGRGQEQGRRPSMGQSDGSRRDEVFRDRARAVM